MDATLDARSIATMHPMLLRYATRRVGSEEAARDVVQETWVAALQGVAAFEGRSSLRTWLVSILRRKIIDRRRRFRMQMPLEEEHGVVTPASPEHRMDAAAALHRVRALIADLPPKERAALELCDVQGVARDEAAQRLGVERGALRVQLHRARAKLRSALDAEGLLES
jgi:RNA polymerase sigma-70 factor (ECF subfamily)